MKFSKRLTIRLTISIALGIGVAWMPLSMARGSWMTQFSPEQMKTQWSLKSVASAVEDYKQRRGSYPTDIQTVLSAEWDDTDGWKRPWVYSVVAGKPLIESLGRDGKRGGSQQDADLSNLAPRPANARLCAWQSALHPAALGLRVTALVTGALMATLVFVLWLTSVASFVLNRYWIKPNFDGALWHSYLNDLLCLPVWMPICVWIFARLKLRDSAPPRPLEIAVCLLFWSVVFEIWLPQTDAFGRFAPGDPFDVLAYAVGGVVGWIWWKRSPSAQPQR